MRQITLLIIAVTMLSMSSCKWLKGDDKDKALARVNDKYLYIEDIKTILPKNLNKNDSAEYVKNYVNNWIRKNLLLNIADKNLKPEQKDFDQLIEDYRNSLLMYNYEQELVRQKLDTNVTDIQISDYYNKHPDDFLLKFNIIKVLYIKLPLKTPDIANAKRWLRSDDPKDREKLEEYCKKNAINYYLDNESWLIFDDLLKEIPIKTYDQENYLQNNRMIEIKDSTANYLLNITGFKIKESPSPLAFERENVKQIIINQRKIDLIKIAEDKIYNDAVKNGDFELFTPKKK